MSIVSLKSSLTGKKGYSTISDDGESDDLESQTPSQAPSHSQQSSRLTTARIISDATIGLADGLTVPFALTAGLSALGDVKVVIYGGLAELTAGAISMGLGGYLGAKSEAESYRETRAETQALLFPQTVVPSSPSPPLVTPQSPLLPESEDYATQALTALLAPFSLPPQTLTPLIRTLKQSPDALLDLLLQHTHGAAAPPPNRALQSALTIALAYFLGGLLPLLPYCLVGTDDTPPGQDTRLERGLRISVAVMAAALFAFGYVKTCVVGGWGGGKRRVARAAAGGVEMVVVGGGAAGAAWGLVWVFDGLAS